MGGKPLSEAWQGEGSGLHSSEVEVFTSITSASLMGCSSSFSPLCHACGRLGFPLAASHCSSRLEVGSAGAWAIHEPHRKHTGRRHGED